MRRLLGDQLEVDVAPEHGMTIVSVIHRQSGIDLLWRHPFNRVRTLPTQLGPGGSSSRQTFEEASFVGGWFVMVPNMGPVTDRIDMWFHGEGARRCWTQIAESESSIVAQLKLASMPVTVLRSVALEGELIRVTTSLQNDGDEDVRVAAGEHPCFNVQGLGVSEFILGESTLSVPANPRVEHNMYEATGRASFEASRIGQRVSLSWDSTSLPAVLTWRRGSAVLAIEPRSMRARSADSALDHEWRTIAPGETFGWELQMVVHNLAAS